LNGIVLSTGPLSVPASTIQRMVDNLNILIVPLANPDGRAFSQSGIANALQDPTIELRDDNGILLFANDNWKESQQTELEANGLAPRNDAESAIVTRLGPGKYTAVLRGKNDSTGVGLVELYRIP
jgi:hypothetical protein